MKNKPYCTAPWNGITVRENGDVKTCCSGLEVLGNLNQDTIENILQSPILVQIQNSLISGQTTVKNCKVCMDLETTTGLAALRQHYLKYYPDIDQGIKIKNLDIRWNNSCNLGCIYCSPTFSSTWEDRLNQKPAQKTKDYQEDLERFILDQADQVREITLVGGEPMLMKQNAKLFRFLPNDTKISIITNISYDIEHLPYIEDLLARPRSNILWALSIENILNQFEYVRNGARWSIVEKNLKFLCKHWLDTTSLLMVYNVLSAFDLARTTAWFRSIGIKKFVFQTYFGHPALNVFALNQSIRQAALLELEQTLCAHEQDIHHEDRDLFAIENITGIINQLKNSDTVRQISRQQFYERMAWCDQWNKHRFRDLWPHVAELVDIHLS